MWGIYYGGTRRYGEDTNNLYIDRLNVVANSVVIQGLTTINSTNEFKADRFTQEQGSTLNLGNGKYRVNNLYQINEGAILHTLDKMKLVFGDFENKGKVISDVNLRIKLESNVTHLGIVNAATNKMAFELGKAVDIQRLIDTSALVYNESSVEFKGKTYKTLEEAKRSQHRSSTYHRRNARTPNPTHYSEQLDQEYEEEFARRLEDWKEQHKDQWDSDELIIEGIQEAIDFTQQEHWKKSPKAQQDLVELNRELQYLKERKQREQHWDIAHDATLAEKIRNEQHWIRFTKRHCEQGSKTAQKDLLAHQYERADLLFDEFAESKRRASSKEFEVMQEVLELTRINPQLYLDLLVLWGNTLFEKGTVQDKEQVILCLKEAIPCDNQDCVILDTLKNLHLELGCSLLDMNLTTTGNAHLQQSKKYNQRIADQSSDW